MPEIQLNKIWGGAERKERGSSRKGPHIGGGKKDRTRRKRVGSTGESEAQGNR